MKEKIRNYQSDIVGILLGVIIALILPLSFVLRKSTRRRLYLDVYFLTRALPPIYRVLLTEFLIFFVAGFVAALVSKRHKLVSSIMVGVITPIIAPCIMGMCFVYKQVILSNIIILTVYALLGGLFYTKVFARLTRNVP